MKTTTEKAVTVFKILNNAKLGKMKDEDKFLVIKAMKQLKPIAMAYDEFIRDAAEKLKPDGVEKIQSKLQQKEELTLEEQQVWVKFNNDVSICVGDELKKENELTFTPLEEEAMKALLASNDFNVAEIMILDEVIGK